MPHKRAKFSERQKERAARGNDLPPTSRDAHLRDMPKGAMRILNAAKVQEEYNARRRAAKAAEQSDTAGSSNVTGKRKGKGKGLPQAQAANGGAADGRGDSQPLRIKPGEKMADFSRRVEATMAKDIYATIRSANDSSSGKKRKRRQERERERDEQARKDGEGAVESGKKTGEKMAARELDRRALKEERLRLEHQASTSANSTADRDWEKATQQRSVRDVVDAPPKLTKAPRGESDAALKRKAQLKAALQGGDAGAAAASAPLRKARLPNPVATPSSKQQPGGLRRQAVLEDERERAIKSYRQAKEAKIQAREKMQQRQ